MTIGSNIFLPDQLYATYIETSDGRLAFVSPFGKDKAFEKRKRTQDNWAYPPSQVKFNAQGRGTKITSVWVIHPTTEERVKEETSEPLADELHPTVLDNELLGGFEISRSVRRGGWSSNSVAWRVKDPRGFELEIASENLARIIDCATITEGVIQGKCTWGRSGPNNILLPEASEPYQLAAKNTKRAKISVSLRDVSVGDIVDVLAPKFDGNEFIYLGKCWYRFLSAYQRRIDPPSGSSRYFGSSITEGYGYNAKDAGPESSYLFKSVDNGHIYSGASPKISKVIAKRADDFDLMEQLDGCTNVNGQYATVSYVSPTKINKGDPVTLRVEPMDLSRSEKESWQNSSLAAKLGTIVSYDGEFWAIQQMRNLTGPDFYDCCLVAVELDLANTNINLTIVPPAVNALFGGRTSHYRVKIIDDHTTLDQPYWIIVNDNFKTKLPYMYL